MQKCKCLVAEKYTLYAEFRNVEDQSFSLAAL